MIQIVEANLDCLNCNLLPMAFHWVITVQKTTILFLFENAGKN